MYNTSIDQYAPWFYDHCYFHGASFTAFGSVFVVYLNKLIGWNTKNSYQWQIVCQSRKQKSFHGRQQQLPEFHQISK